MTAAPEPTAAAAAAPRVVARALPASAGESAPESELKSGVLPLGTTTGPSSSEQLSSPQQLPLSATSRVRGLSIGQKLALLILLLVATIVVSLTAYSQMQQVDSLQSRLERKADTYAQLLSWQVRSAVAFDDRETAREAFEALASDQELGGVVLFGSKGTVLESWGTLSELAQKASSGVNERRVFELPDRVLAVSPVVSLEGPKGVLALELSKATLTQSLRVILRTNLILGCSALLVGVLLALAISQSFAKRLRAIARVAGLVAEGDLTQTVPSDGSRDEIGSLNRSFGVMLEQLKRLILEIRTRAEQEQARLEGLVEQRTRALARRNADMRRVLDTVDQGFLTLDRQGRISEERSRIIADWFGPAPESGILWDYLEQAAPGVGVPLMLGWEQLVDGLMPLEAALEQLPRAFVLGRQHFSISYKPTLNDAGELDSMLVVLSDVTQSIERQRLEDEEREVVRLFTRVLEDRAGVLEFLAEANKLVEHIAIRTPADTDETKRLVHTLKGNAGIFGLESLARLCHSIEDNMLEQGSNISTADAQRLAGAWRGLSSKLGRFIESPGEGGITLDDAEYRGILSAIAAGMPHRQIAALVEAWRLEPVEARLTRLARQAEGIAARLHKLPMDVRVEAQRVRLDSSKFSEVWATLPHLLRNAIDHGIESAAERQQLGKRGPSAVILRAAVDGPVFSIEVEDTGRGVDWEALRGVARARGLPCASQRDLIDALFADGVSTRQAVTDSSGRGVGAAAVARAVQAAGGKIDVFSETGKGTRFRLSWPATVARISFAGAATAGAARSSGSQKLVMKS